MWNLRNARYQGGVAAFLHSIQRCGGERTPRVVRRSLNKSTPQRRRPEMASNVSLIGTEGMAATERCDRCGGQAYVEVALRSGGTLLFCAHHASEHSGKLVTLDATITDHRPYLKAQEAVTTLNGESRCA
jgi:hypothetical protein